MMILHRKRSRMRDNEGMLLSKKSGLKVDGSIVKYLIQSQRDGVRLLYENFKTKKGAIINGPGNCLFNEWIVFTFIHCIVTPAEGQQNNNKSRCMIVTSTEEKKLVWLKFFEYFLPAVLLGTEKDPAQICCICFDELIENYLGIGKKLSLIVFDEAEALIDQLSTKVYAAICPVPVVFIVDSKHELFDDLQRLHKFVKYCGHALCHKDPFEFINEFCGRQKRSKLRNFCRCFHFELFFNELEQQAPTETNILNDKFTVGQSNTEISYQSSSSKSSSEPFKFKTIYTTPTKSNILIENMPFVEGFTCNMSPLRLESSDSSDIYLADTVPFDTPPLQIDPIPKIQPQPSTSKGFQYRATPPLRVPFLTESQESAISVYAQEIDTNFQYDDNDDPKKYKSYINDKFTQENSIDDLYRSMNNTNYVFPSTCDDVKEVNAPLETIVISSGSNGKNEERYGSPELFSDSEEETIQENKVPEKELPNVGTSNNKELIRKNLQLEKCMDKMSTPIAKLCNEEFPSQSPIGFLSPDFWLDSETKKRKAEENMFEITKNDVFSNLIRINQNNEMSPVTPVQDLEKQPKYNWESFLEKEKQLKDIEQNKTEENPKIPDEDIEIFDLTEDGKNDSLLRTPTSNKMTTPQSSRESSKKLYRSGHGWLSKYSPVVAPKTPRTPKNRRKRLDKLFNESAATKAKDTPLSPDDLFE